MKSGINLSVKLYLAAVLLAWLSFATLAPLIRQDPSYHQFAGARLWNVVTNLPFVAVGLLGLWLTRTTAARILSGGVFLTGIGSAHYHWSPGDARLVWDRPPMTIVFTALLSLIISEWVGPPLGRRVLWPLLAFGNGSVVSGRGLRRRHFPIDRVQRTLNQTSSGSGCGILDCKVELHLLRHGIAEHRAASGRDQDRSLTDDGVDRLRGVIAQAKETGLDPKWIVASPYLRALQTARIAADILGYSEPILTSTRLTPESDPAELWAEVRDIAPDSPLLFVAHEPLLSATASWMVGESRVMIEFRPATLVRIDFETVGPEPAGVLRWKLHGT